MERLIYEMLDLHYIEEGPYDGQTSEYYVEDIDMVKHTVRNLFPEMMDLDEPFIFYVIENGIAYIGKT